MVKSVEKRLFLRDSDGGVTPFDAYALQTRLISAFLAAGLKEESCISEEIVLALEYTLLTASRPEPVFSTAEVDAAVIRTLESTGYPEAAAAFRATGHEQINRIAVSQEALERLFTAHLGCSNERAAKTAGIVCEKLRLLEITAATPHLLMELARHFERDLAEQDSVGSVNIAGTPPQVTMTKADIHALLPENARMLIDAGILRINDMTTLFPSIRFFFFMNKFAVVNQLGKPVTELEIIPLLYAAGNTLEDARSAINNAFPAAGELPCCLTLPDMSVFMNSYAGEHPDPALAEEFAAALCTGFKCKLYNLVSG